jgi:hypothetical protein
MVKTYACNLTEVGMTVVNGNGTEPVAQVISRPSKKNNTTCIASDLEL